VAIHDDDVAAVKAATDIVALITGYVQLRKVGRRWQGLCPFHGEKTPSFSVNGEEGMYYCFGCQRTGDVFTFVQEVEQLDFVGAVELLAGKLGHSLRYTERAEGESRRRRTRLTAALEDAVEWYHQRLLTATDAAPARKYLRSRGFDGERVRAFRLGWAPQGWDEAVKALHLTKDVATDTGLAKVNSSGRLQDFFRSRVLFPIFDPQGGPLGFGGRLLPGATGPKYLNPGATPLYDKSKVLYGLNWAKIDVVSAGEVIVCEGYTDVIGFHVAGVPRAVATCGTALTEDHVRLLTRFANRVVLAFDADNAGQSAAERFHAWEKRYGIDVVVAALPTGVDPGELSQKDPAALRKAVEDATPFLAFRLERLFGAANLNTVEGRARAAQAAVAVVAGHPDPLVRDQYLMTVASRCRVDMETLRTLPVQPVPAQQASAGRGSGRGGKRLPVDDGRSLRPAGGIGISTGRPAQPGQRPRAGSSGRPHPDNHERVALRLAAENPGLVEEWFEPVLFSDPTYQEAARLLSRHGGVESAAQLADEEVADILRQVAAEQYDAEPQEVFLRLAREAAVRELRMASISAIGSIDLATRSAVESLGRWHGVLVDYDRPEDERLQAGIDLLTWLLDQAEERG
jgi:DNA primase